MSVRELSDDPFKAALGSGRGVGAPSIQQTSTVKLEPEARYVVEFPDGRFLWHSSHRDASEPKSFSDCTHFHTEEAARASLLVCEPTGLNPFIENSFAAGFIDSQVEEAVIKKVVAVEICLEEIE